jgi:hypothetical protein
MPLLTLAKVTKTIRIWACESSADRRQQGEGRGGDSESVDARQRGRTKLRTLNSLKMSLHNLPPLKGTVSRDFLLLVFS